MSLTHSPKAGAPYVSSQQLQQKDASPTAWRRPLLQVAAAATQEEGSVPPGLGQGQDSHGAVSAGRGVQASLEAISSALSPAPNPGLRGTPQTPFQRSPVRRTRCEAPEAWGPGFPRARGAKPVQTESLPGQTRLAQHTSPRMAPGLPFAPLPPDVKQQPQTGGFPADHDLLPPGANLGKRHCTT